ncbi:hypothetical protein H5410_063382, partial [Solanum commersonii]
MVNAETDVPASDVLVSNESPVKYENGFKTGKCNAEDKTHDQSDSKGEDLKNARSETPTIDAGTDDELHNIDEGEVNEVHLSEKMIYEVNQNGNDLMVARQEDLQMKANPTTVTTDGDARSCKFPKVKLEVTDFSIGKTPEPASPIHSGEASENISALMADGEDDEGSSEDQAVFIDKLGTFYREKAMEFKLPKFYGHPLNCLKLWRSVIRLGGHDRVTGLKLWRQLLLQYERHRTQNGELQLPIAPPPGSSGVDNEGSGYQISSSGRAVRDSAARCRLGWQEQHLLGYGEVAEPIVKDRSANNTSLKTSGSLKHLGQNEVEHPMKASETETSKPLDVQVVDVGPPADWVKINVRETNDSFEVYALVPGLSREEVQSDPAGRLVITGQPNQFDNLWGVIGFKKVVTLPARIDQLRSNAVFTLHGCLHVHVPFAQQ